VAAMLVLEIALGTRFVLICTLVTLVCSFTVLSQTAEAVELPEFFENMTVRYGCSANVRMPSGPVVFNMTGQCIDTVVEMNENASIELVFTVVSMSGELPAEVSDVFFPFPLEAKNTTIEVPVAQSTQLYWNIFLDDALFSSYKTKGYFLGEENFDTSFGTVGTYHVRRVGACQTYDVFYDKATGWVVCLEETYGGGQVQNYTVTYSIEMAETNATLSPPLSSEFPYFYLLIVAILVAIAGGAGLFYFRRKSKTSQHSQPSLN